jgi:hypothetical protein
VDNIGPPKVPLSIVVREAGGGITPEDNKLRPEDRAGHDWYRFVLSFPPHLIRKYVDQFGLSPAATVLDPFCGTGTTLVECKKLGIASIGIERKFLPAALRTMPARSPAIERTRRGFSSPVAEGFDQSHPPS